MSAGALYFAIVFAVGFVLGVLRVLILAPMLGPDWALAVELPLMLGVSWIACGYVVRRCQVPTGSPRVIMGAVAFMLLMATEFMMSVWLFGRAAESHLALLLAPGNLAGLAGQIVFGVMPVLHHASRQTKG